MKKYSIFFLSGLLLLGYGCTQSEVEEISSISFIIGDVKRNNEVAEIGDILKEKDMVITGNQSSCDIKIGKSIVRIKQKTRLELTKLMRKDNIEKITLGMDIGKMLCSTKKLLKSESFLIKTSTAVAGVRGTKFTVESDKRKTTRIKVFKGKVKVARRVKQLENKIEKILEIAPSVMKEQKVIITEKQVKETEKKVEKILKEEPEKNIEVALVKVVEKIKDDVIVKKKEIKNFKIDDFKKENDEIIAIEEKPKEVIKKIIKIVKQEKKKPKPDGTLMITRYEIYFIKNGKVIWEGKVINPPIKAKDTLYIASGDHVFCASMDGPVLWKKKIENDGKIKILGDKLQVNSQGETKMFELINGDEIKL